MPIVPQRDIAVAPGFWAELRDAVQPRTALLVLGVLLLQLGFIVSFVGAFHSPKPSHLSVDLVVPQFVSAKLVNELDHLSGQPVTMHLVAKASTARSDVLSAKADGAFVVNLGKTTDRLLVASGGGSATATALETVFHQVDAHVHRTLDTSDIVPVQSGDGNGLTGYYLVTGWIVGGYLVAAILGVAKGARPTTIRRAMLRITTVVPYAIVSALGGALIVGPILGALNGHLWLLLMLGILLILSSAIVTMAFQTLFGVVGIGITILLFVILGNPSAGGAYQWSLLPAFWRDLGPRLPNGAGTDAVRQVVYFGSHGVTANMLIVCLYILGGLVVTVVGSRSHPSRHGATPAEERLIALGKAGYQVDVRR